ncbi:membrane protein [Mycobacterium sp. SWH-M5]|uniref:hypothetical protein n=1 Tax=Mycolicibacterium goodii TaxID=134601 RepID=UPI00093F5C10|nr:hypothetical protein [Mycolicibacterium goodii]OKH64981.1 membrane protein [Mycobacterium sp. SWH-M5]PJK18271.1 hypothetical protein CSX11_32160 [Mycolicibacterium goodii]
MRRRAVIQMLLAVVAAVGCVWSWIAASSTVEVAPVLPGEPVTYSVTYSAPILALALLLATVAGVLVVLGVANARRR